MELGGVVTIKCEKTGYSAELEFKLKVCSPVVFVGIHLATLFGRCVSLLGDGLSKIT
jgi:hypothetical protein